MSELLSPNLRSLDLAMLRESLYFLTQVWT